MTRHVANGMTHKGVTSSNSDVTEASGSRDEENHPASVEFLIRKCAESFDVEGNCQNEDFLRVLFLTHLWFMTSEQLIVLFSQLYEEEKSTCDFGKKIFFAIRFWLHEFPHMFDLDQKLVNALQDLQDLSLNDPDVDTSIIDLSNKDSYKWMSEAHMSIRPNQANRKRRKVSLVFNHLEPEEIAIHMTYLEYKSFRRLTLSDFHNYAVHGAIKDNLKLERVVFLFNNITHWVQCMILDHHKPQERAVAIVKFVEVAKKLYAMRNFNTLMAIVGAITHTAIARMKKTMLAVPKDTLKILEEFVELLDSKSNYCGYRRAYGHVVNEFKIPIVGILMKDLIALHAALPDRVGDGLINVRKMMMIGAKFQELIGIQRIPFPYEVNRDLVNTLRVSLYLYYNEEEIYQLSTSREPRDVKHSTSGTTPSPSKLFNMGFAEFASFTCQLGDDTIKQHVTAMVGSVFKTYDQNSDGFISEVEFENFIQNFPGLDSFATVDKDQDGRISMSEMVDYFLKISSTRRNQVCQSFKHDFVETTYFHPTFCEECQKLLWGLVKQGWKCKDCGINCHKHCKDRIVQECRPKRNGHVSKKGEKSRDKASVSSESDLSANGEQTNCTRSPAADDEAFDSGDSKPLLSPAMKRSTSVPAADVNSVKSTLQPSNNRRAKMTSKTPPPTRKPSSPTLSHDVGRKSLQRKMQNMLKKRNSVKRIGHDAGTQTPNQSDFSPSIHEKRSHDEGVSDKDEGDHVTNERLKVKDDSTAKHDQVGMLSPSNQQPQIHRSTNSLHEERASARRDSGLSSCSCLTLASASTSAPVTPLFYDQVGEDSTFQYPATSSSSESSSPNSHSPASIRSKKCALPDPKSLALENLQLRRENEELRKKLETAHDVILHLESKLNITHCNKLT